MQKNNFTVRVLYIQYGNSQPCFISRRYDLMYSNLLSERTFFGIQKLVILHRIFLQAPKMILVGKKMFDIRLQSRPRSQTNCLANNCFLQRDCFVFSTTIYCQWRKEDCPLCPGMGLCLQGHQSCL